MLHGGHEINPYLDNTYMPHPGLPWWSWWVGDIKFNVFSRQAMPAQSSKVYRLAPEAARKGNADWEKSSIFLVAATRETRFVRGPAPTMK